MTGPTFGAGIRWISPFPSPFANRGFMAPMSQLEDAVAVGIGADQNLLQHVEVVRGVEISVDRASPVEPEAARQIVKRQAQAASKRRIHPFAARPSHGREVRRPARRAHGPRTRHLIAFSPGGSEGTRNTRTMSSSKNGRAPGPNTRSTNELALIAEGMSG